MKTIFVYDDNIDILIATILVFLLFLLAIAGAIYFFPLLKASCSYVHAILTKKFNKIHSEKSAVAIVLVLTLFFYSLIGLLGFYTGKSLIENKFVWISTNCSTCDIVSGKCENLNYNLIETRYRNYYKCNFSVADIKFSDVEIDGPYEDIVKYLDGDYQFKIYYRVIKGTNYIVKIDLERERDNQ